MTLKESLLKQKSRVDRVKEGYCNTRFFHKGRKEDAKEIKFKVRGHFDKNFVEEISERTMLGGIDMTHLLDEDEMCLEEPFSENEIKGAVWNCNGNKIPGPDGSSLSFLQSYWEKV